MSGCDAWVMWSDDGWAVSFRYPPADAAGRPVTVDRREPTHGFQRVHVLADDRDEIYFEVVRGSGLSAQTFYASMQERMPELYPDVSFAPLSAVGAWQQGSFRWADEERVVLFAEHGAFTYRVIYRPRSAINHEIWETVEIE